MQEAPVVDVVDLCKTYSEGWLFARSFTALKHVSLQVHRGEVFGLLGPNGAGKTTLIKIMLGILHATSGKATVLGMPAGSQTARRRIGYLPENMAFPRHHTGLDALRFYSRLSGLSETPIREREGELLELVGLQGRQFEPVRKYSKGMRQRLGLAQAMMHDPDILIMDEPTDGLDPVGRSQIRRVIETLRAQGKTIFLNSHILQEVELICDRVAILVKGQVRCVGTIAELSTQLDQRMLVRLQVLGSPESLQRCWENRPIVSDDANVDQPPALPGQHRRRQSLVLELKSQSELDDLVDQLRNQQVSLEHLELQQAGLEEVFMNVVQTSEVAQHT
jgi:ABC-2 type transport system ATP-binding protein